MQQKCEVKCLYKDYHFSVTVPRQCSQIYMYNYRT